MTGSSAAVKAARTSRVPGERQRVRWREITQNGVGVRIAAKPVQRRGGQESGLYSSSGPQRSASDRRASALARTDATMDVYR